MIKINALNRVQNSRFHFNKRSYFAADYQQVVLWIYSKYYSIPAIQNQIMYNFTSA